jgi:hypothetical protein
MKKWTKEEKQLVKEYWLSGKSAGWIALKFDVCPPQVQGQLHIMKLYKKRNKS